MLAFIAALIKYFLYAIFAFFIFVFMFLKFAKVFGAKPSKQKQKKYSNSKNYENGRFKNLMDRYTIFVDENFSNVPHKDDREALEGESEQIVIDLK